MALPRVNAADDLPLGRRMKVYVEGYEVKVATVLAPGFDTETQNAHVYGSDDPLTSTVVNGSNLTMELLEKSNNNRVLQILSGLRPESLDLKEYKWQQFDEVTVWINLQHPKSDRYVRACLWRRWRPGPGDESAPPNEWMRRTLVGQADTQFRFDEAVDVGVRIESEKLDLVASGSGSSVGYTFTLSRAPARLPSSAVNLIRLLVIDGTAAGAVSASDEVEIDLNTCANGSTACWIDNEELINAKGKADYAFVQYLYTGTGTVATDTSQKTDGKFKAM